MDSTGGSLDSNFSTYSDVVQHSVCHQGNRTAFPAKSLQTRLKHLKTLKNNALPGWTDFLPKQSAQDLNTVNTVPAAYEPSMPTLLAAMHAPVNWQGCEAPGSGLQQTSVSGKVWAESRNGSEGSKRVQAAFDAAVDRQDIQLLLSLTDEMKGHVPEAAFDLHANYVIQKAILLRARQCGPKSIQFVFEELLARGVSFVHRACRHNIACRILQRLLEVCSQEQAAKIGAEILIDAEKLCTDKYGTYVIQAMLDRGDRIIPCSNTHEPADAPPPAERLQDEVGQQVQRVLHILRLNAAAIMSKDDKGAASAVLTKGLKSRKAAVKDKEALAREIIVAFQVNAGLYSMAKFDPVYELARDLVKQSNQASDQPAGFPVMGRAMSPLPATRGQPEKDPACTSFPEKRAIFDKGPSSSPTGPSNSSHTDSGSGLNLTVHRLASAECCKHRGRSPTVRALMESWNDQALEVDTPMHGTPPSKMNKKFPPSAKKQPKQSERLLTKPAPRFDACKFFKDAEARRAEIVFEELKVAFTELDIPMDKLPAFWKAGEHFEDINAAHHRVCARRHQADILGQEDTAELTAQWQSAQAAFEACERHYKNVSVAVSEEHGTLKQMQDPIAYLAQKLDEHAHRDVQDCDKDETFAYIRRGDLTNVRLRSLCEPSDLDTPSD